jgi:hypothetical protein
MGETADDVLELGSHEFGSSFPSAIGTISISIGSGGSPKAGATWCGGVAGSGGGGPAGLAGVNSALATRWASAIRFCSSLSER